MKPLIKVQGLAKRYRIGRRQTYRTLRESIASTARAPLAFLKKARDGADEHVMALGGVSFEVMPGEVLGVIGRNGAGKSTLLKVLSRVTEPSAGRIELCGRVGSLLEVGTGFHPELTGRENVYLSGAILGMKRAEIARKFDEMVAFAEVEKFVDTPVKHYSSGMYVRLAFAVAAHLEPEILLIDEVLAVGDIAFQRKCLERMGMLSQSGRTVLFVSHNMASIHRLCPRAMLLNQGVAEMIGSAAQVIHRYQDSAGGVAGSVARGVSISGARITAAGGAEFSRESAMVCEALLQTERRLDRCHLNLHVEDAEGRMVIHSRTDFAGLYPSFDPGAHRIRVALPRLDLRAGMYAVWMRLYVGGALEELIADSERILLEVAGHTPGQGLLDIPSQWSWAPLRAGTLEDPSAD